MRGINPATPTTMTIDQQNYWDSVGADWQRRWPHRLWREFSDRQQIGLLLQWTGGLLTRWASGWIGAGSRPALLKTDLFDEVASQGIVPWLLASGAHVTGLDVVETTAVMHCPRAIAVAVAGPMERLSRSWQESFLRHLQAWERLERWPTRWLTGHYVAVHAVAPREHGVKPLSR